MWMFSITTCKINKYINKRTGAERPGVELLNPLLSIHSDLLRDLSVSFSCSWAAFCHLIHHNHIAARVRGVLWDGRVVVCPGEVHSQAMDRDRRKTEIREKIWPLYVWAESFRSSVKGVCVSKYTGTLLITQGRDRETARTPGLSPHYWGDVGPCLISRL